MNSLIADLSAHFGVAIISRSCFLRFLIRWEIFPFSVRAYFDCLILWQWLQSPFGADRLEMWPCLQGFPVK
jgi:hypothetical protein